MDGFKMIGFLGLDMPEGGDLCRFEFHNLLMMAMFEAWMPAIYKEYHAFDGGWYVDVWCSESFAIETEGNFILDWEDRIAMN